MQKRPYFYLIAGANGAGKTTLAKELLTTDHELVFLNPDEIAREIGDDLGLKAGRILLNKLDDLFKAGKEIVMESTISGKHHLAILERARQANYYVGLYYVFLPAVEMNLQRVQNRVLLGGHDVPSDAIYRRYQRSINNFWSTKTLVDHWVLYYNTQNSFTKIAYGNALEKNLNQKNYNTFKELSNVDSR